MRFQTPALLAIVSVLLLGASNGATAPLPPSLYISPTGSDAAPCTRQEPCATFARAYLVARPGQVVELADGTYNGIQEIPFDAKKTSASDVVFRPAAGATARLANGIDVYGRHVTLQGLTIDTVLYVKCGAEDVTLRGSKAAAFFIRPARGVSLINDEFGPVVNVSSTIGPSQDCPQPPSEVLLDHVYMHDVYTVPHNSQHIECLMVNLVDGLTIRNSRFQRCEDYDILFKRDFGDINISNVALENNWFDVPYPDGWTAVAFSDPANASYTNVLIRGNSFNAGLLPVGGPGVVVSRFRIIGNVGTSISVVGDPCHYPGLTRAYNVWADSRRCNSTEKRAPTGFVNAKGFDLHLARGAAAINRGDPKSYPLRDIDGQRRPIGKRPDAGADESVYGKPKAKGKTKGH